MDTNILLESGTNELEILEFQVGTNHYGINVAKIKEILPYKRPTAIPNAHPCIEGIYMPRDTIITIVDLARSLSIPESEDVDKDMYIVTNFNQLSIAFHVHTVLGIHRVSWAEISKPDESINNSGKGVATGIIKLNDRLIVILDFEKIVSDISPETGLKVSDIDQLGERQRNNSPILIAEDSPLLSKLIFDSLTKAGYTNVTVTNNGKEAYDKLMLYKENGTLKDKVKCVITDIEMPQMDGHHLTKLIKEDNALKHLPVVIFSSLVNDEMRKKGESLGADAQLSKPEIGMLVEEIDKLLFK
ncbi:MAG: chemotaxis protein CheV [Lachnospiraceae bacterium]|nr:chemotaxis protein CheV [Lachnospiraceae bacterium]MBQ6090326.1 chemotaxis protein CheV [Lachnospiraceae bacterium]MBR5368709.1 chemotaxis protein CheV [Lachnospiraceae bacterium]